MTYETLAQMTNEQLLKFTQLLEDVNYETEDYPYVDFDGQNCDGECAGVYLGDLLEDGSSRCDCGNRRVSMYYDSLYGFWVFEAY